MSGDLMHVGDQSTASERNASAAPLGDISPRAHPPHAHAVQFYDDEAYLASVVSEFLADGIRSGEFGLVIATPAHRDAFMRRLGDIGIDVKAARRAGRLQLLDARQTLSKFMSGNDPNPERFAITIGSLIVHGLRDREERIVRAYGEMVDLLWKDGNAEGALQSERLWNDLATRHRFSLLCAYSMANFCHATDASAFHD